MQREPNHRATTEWHDDPLSSGQIRYPGQTLAERWPDLEWNLIGEAVDEAMDRLSHLCVDEWLAWQAGDSTVIEVIYDVDRNVLTFWCRGRYLCAYPEQDR